MSYSDWYEENWNEYLSEWIEEKDDKLLAEMFAEWMELQGVGIRRMFADHVNSHDNSFDHYMERRYDERDEVDVDDEFRVKHQD